MLFNIEVICQDGDYSQVVLVSISGCRVKSVYQGQLDQSHNYDREKEKKIAVTYVKSSEPQSRRKLLHCRSLAWETRRVTKSVAGFSLRNLMSAN